MKWAASTGEISSRTFESLLETFLESDKLRFMTIPESNSKLRPLTWSIVIKAILGVAFTALFLWLWQTSIVRLTKNFYEVDPGKFYRSAQLSPTELEEVIKKYGIKTVISLRGAPENSYWVPGQKKVLEANGVQFHSFSWTTDFFPDTEQFKGYLNLLKTGEFPVLVHCRTGADRTGEATALYAIDYMKMPKEEAIEKYLSFKYWHVQKFHPAKAEFVKRYSGMDEALSNYNHCAPENIAFAEPGHCSGASSNTN
jgi:protein tyrosine/serine phosphatase